MSLQAVRNRYVQDAVSTVTPAKLVTMLYDALTRDLQLAEQANGPARQAAQRGLDPLDESRLGAGICCRRRGRHVHRQPPVGAGYLK